jgi:glucuronoarabinoxylan endo-1,4-beta-xylanase
MYYIPVTRGHGVTPTRVGGGGAEVPPIADIVVTATDLHQTIDGFGASDAYLGGFPLSDAQADMYFLNGTSGQIGLTYLRTAIASDGTKFRGDYSNCTKAAARGALIWAAPWTAPAVWKDNNSETNGGFLLVGHYDDWATRLAAFQSVLLANAGVNLYALSVQNEPDYTASYESMLYTYPQMTAFLKVLGPKVAALSPRPKIILPETSSWANGFNYSGDTLADAVAAPYLDIIGVHQYAGLAAPPNAARKIWETEMASFDAFDPGIFNGMGVAQWIHDSLTTGNVTAWHYWWLFGHDGSNQGLIGENNSTSPPTKRFSTMGHYSKFVRPGYVRLGTSAMPSGISLTAFRNLSSGQCVLVAINVNSFDITPTVGFFQLGSTISTMTPWVTDTTRDLVTLAPLPVTNRVFTAAMPGYSVNTFVSA